MLAGFRLGRRPPPPSSRMLVTVVDVGHGEAAWIRTLSGKFILIGGGPVGAGDAVVRSLRTAGARQIDLLILPYPYNDSIGGIPEVIRQMPIREVMEPGWPPPPRDAENEVQRAVQGLLAERDIPLRILQAPQTIRVEEARIEVLAPTVKAVQESPRPANNSHVLRLSFGTTRFLFAGGVERAGEIALLARTPDLSAQWLRVARFGTREATSAEFLRLVRPEVAVISVGKGNSGGYPHRETLERLQAAGVRLYRTDEEARDLTFESDGIQIRMP